MGSTACPSILAVEVWQVRWERDPAVLMETLWIKLSEWRDFVRLQWKSLRARPAHSVGGKTSAPAACPGDRPQRLDFPLLRRGFRLGGGCHTEQHGGVRSWHSFGRAPCHRLPAAQEFCCRGDGGGTPGSPKRLLYLHCQGPCGSAPPGWRCRGAGQLCSAALAASAHAYR